MPMHNHSLVWCRPVKMTLDLWRDRKKKDAKSKVAVLNPPYSSFLFQVGEHDNGLCVLLPYHAPEVDDRMRDGSL